MLITVNVWRNLEISLVFVSSHIPDILLHFHTGYFPEHTRVSERKTIMFPRSLKQPPHPSIIYMAAVIQMLLKY